MQNQVQVFQNEEFGKVRVIEKDGQPWWVLTDVCKALGLSNPSIVAQRLDDDERLKVDPKSDLGSRSNTPVTIISESGLYATILRSDKPQARAFRKWITSVVVPSIRLHGAYISPDILRRMREDRAFADELLERLENAETKNQALTAHVKKLRPKARYCDVILQPPQAVPVSIVAKDYGMTATAFNRLLHELGVQYRVGRTWLLYKDLSDRGYTVSKTYQIGGEVTVHTCWTQKGRQFIYRLLSLCGILPCVETATDEAA